MIFLSFFQMNRVQQPCNMGTAPTNFHSVFWVYLWLLLILIVWFTIRNPLLSDEPYNEEILLLQTHFGCENFEKKSRIFLLVFVFNLKCHWIIIVKSFENWIVKKCVTRYCEKPLLLLYAKVQLILKSPFGVSKSTKRPNKFL